MTATLFMKMQVENFDTWLNPDQEQVGENFREAGVLAFGLHRSPDDGNSLLGWFQCADADAAKAFHNWYVGIKPDYIAQNPGAEHEIVDAWVGTDMMLSPPPA